MRYLHKVLAIMLCCVFISVSIGYAQQDTRFGVKAGVSSYTLSGNAVWQVNASSKTFVTFGALAEIGVAPNLAIQPELNYVVKGASSNYVVDIGGSGPLDITEKVKLTYLQVPVLIKYTFPVNGKLKPAFFVGPAVSFKVSAKDDITGYGDSRDGNKDIANVRSADFGGILGAAVSFPLGKMMGTLGARYDMSLGNAFKDTNPDSVPSNEVAFLEGDVPFWDPDYGNYTTKALDLSNRGFSIDFQLTFPIGK